MKKYIKQIIGCIVLLSFLGCDEYMDINTDPNVSTDVPAELLLKGMELADVQIQSGHIMRISQFWIGQMKGVGNSYGKINDYIISPEETNGVWGHMYHGIMTQNDVIQKSTQDMLVKGMANVIEAHGIGTMASLFGDIPYSKVGIEQKGAFDNQADVFDAAQKLLSEAITQLGSVPTARRNTNDIFLGGNPVAWIQVAYTLKARYYLMTRQYTEAYDAALKGINSKTNSLRYAAAYAAYGTTQENSNLYNLILTGSRSGDLTSKNSFIQNLLDVSKTTSRNNSKTNESRRRDFLILESTGINANRLSTPKAQMPLVIYEENLLILAEAGLRKVSFDEGLTRLNALRVYLKTGASFAGDPTLTIKYDSYVSSDFNAGGIENKDNLDPNKALLREIMEERYVSCFGTIVPFDDVRRIRSTDNDISIPLPINSGSSHPERFLISQEEINGNEFSPSPIPGLFVKTPVNK